MSFITKAEAMRKTRHTLSCFSFLLLAWFFASIAKRGNPACSRFSKRRISPQTTRAKKKRDLYSHLDLHWRSKLSWSPPSSLVFVYVFVFVFVFRFGFARGSKPSWPPTQSPLASPTITSISIKQIRHQGQNPPVYYYHGNFHWWISLQKDPRTIRLLPHQTHVATKLKKSVFSNTSAQFDFCEMLRVNLMLEVQTQLLSVEANSKWRKKLYLYSHLRTQPVLVDAHSKWRQNFLPILETISFQGGMDSIDRCLPLLLDISLFLFISAGNLSLSLFISLMRTFSFTSPPWLCPEQPLLLLTWADLLSISTAIIYCCPFHYISTNTIPTLHYISSAIICYLLSLSSSWELSLRENATAAIIYKYINTQIHKYTNTH